jgi:glycerol-3-phosphate dehydrogenase
MIPDREEMLRKAVSTDRWDMIVIGGGATGLGTALDATSRGYSVLLLEAHDFGKGTSSRSTKLVHGGVRYLRQGNVKMVMKALRERGRLLKNAPHIVHPLRFVIPCYKWWHKPFYGIGMKVYDALARSLSIAPSLFIDREETLAYLPGIRSEGLRGGIAYWDGQFDDTRLLISLAQTTAMNRGVLINYMRVTGLVRSGNRVSGVRAMDQETGEEYTFQGLSVINATGIFTDSVRSMDEAGAKPMMAAAQGIHLVLDASFLSTDTAVMVPDTDDGRVVFGVPWHGSVLFGTTDTLLDHIDEEPRALEAEIDYLLDHAGRYFSRKPGRADIQSVFAGIRPLVRANKAQTKSISRDHTLIVSKSGLVTITGGKWTTYRQMAEDAVNGAEKSSGRKKRVCLTRSMPLLDSSLAVEGEPTQAEARDAERIHAKLGYTFADVRRAVRSEWARTLEDVLARRTRCLFLNAGAAIEAAPVVAAIMAAELGWTEDRQAAEIKQFNVIAKAYLVSNHG